MTGKEAAGRLVLGGGTGTELRLLLYICIFGARTLAQNAKTDRRRLQAGRCCVAALALAEASFDSFSYLMHGCYAGQQLYSCMTGEEAAGCGCWVEALWCRLRLIFCYVSLEPGLK